MKKIIIVFLLSVNLFAQSWKLIWSDEFDGTTLNTNYWSFEIGTGTNGWGNNELQYYTSRSNNIKVENGMLVITALQESFGGRNYTSARIKTQGKKSFKYGKIEARMKLPVGKGSWPAFWMLGDNITFLGWPKCGEIDIMEHINNTPDVYGTMHYDYNGHISKGGSTICDVTEFHNYSIEWDANSIKWFVDGKQYFSNFIVNGINSTEEFHQPFFIILNLAIGGNWPGNPDGSMQFPISMYVDYVRVYELVTNIENDIYEIPYKFSLEQNFPNPFNPITKIKFTLPKDGFTKLAIYDLLGNEIKIIVSENRSAGQYEVLFNSENLPSGIYIYKLQQGNLTQAKKLILLK